MFVSGESVFSSSEIYFSIKTKIEVISFFVLFLVRCKSNTPRFTGWKYYPLKTHYNGTNPSKIVCFLINPLRTRLSMRYFYADCIKDQIVNEVFLRRLY